MGTTLTGTTPQDTYDSLIKVTDNGPLSGTAKYLSDGLGNDSALALSTTAVGIGTNAPTQKLQVTSGNILTQGVSGGGAFNILQPITTISDARTWAIGASVAAFGDFAIKQSNAKDGDPITAGDTKFYISNTGNVGIGTSAPIDTLQVNGGISVGSDATANNRSRIYESFGLNIEGGAATDRPLVFRTNLLERMRISYTGVVELALGQIKFPATQVPSADANTLDDYEEGTFTPTVEGSSTAGTATYSVQIGKYTKIGNQISILIDLAWSGGTGTGILRIVGLPFTNVAFNTAGTIGFINDIALTALNYATTYVAPSSTRLDFVQSPTGGGSVTDVPYDAAGRLIVSATYFNA